jgi:isopenicillin N synthase-like dioxygenase
MIENSDANLFRILHYPPLTGEHEPGAVRAAAHEDINLITLLPAATAPGLEVKDSHGHWISVPCDPGNIIINAGDMLQLASEGYYKSTTHRVVNPPENEAKKSRYSMPLFLHPRSEAHLSPTLTAGEYLNQRLREIGLKN